MRTSQIIALLCMSAATVASLPSPVRPLQPEQRAAPDPDSTSTSTSNNKCADAQKLADGIEDNISVQKQEKSDVAATREILSVDTVDRAKFQSAKETLLRTVNLGISIRQTNERIAPSRNSAIAGLRTVANTQKSELSLAESLTGTVSDLEVISRLEDEFTVGIEQNETNKEAALFGCT